VLLDLQFPSFPTVEKIFFNKGKIQIRYYNVVSDDEVNLPKKILMGKLQVLRGSDW